jgi:ubiquinone/menaquinone biosynthesis C-methylase UbiE
MPLFDHFDLLAPFYDRLLNYQSRETLISLANLPINGRLLDAGGGTGRVAQTLVGKASPIIVADVSHPMLQQAAAKDGLKPVQTGAEALPFPDSTFDRIIMVDAFHHLVDQNKTARELFRALKPGGIIVIEEPDIQRLVVKLVAVAEKAFLMRSHFLSARRIEALFSGQYSRTRVVREGINAWIIIEKLAEPDKGNRDA